MRTCSRRARYCATMLRPAAANPAVGSLEILIDEVVALVELVDLEVAVEDDSNRRVDGCSDAASSVKSRRFAGSQGLELVRRNERGPAAQRPDSARQRGSPHLVRG